MAGAFLSPREVVGVAACRERLQERNFECKSLKDCLESFNECDSIISNSGKL
jgi:hypothetical protein